MESLIVLNYLHFFQYDTWNLQWLNYPFLCDVQAEKLLYNHKVFCGIFKLTNKQNYQQTQTLITRWCEMVWDSQEAHLNGTEICFTGILASAFIYRIWVKPLNFRSPFFFSTVFTDPNTTSLLIIHKCLSYSHKSERQFYHHITCSVT